MGNETRMITVDFESVRAECEARNLIALVSNSITQANQAQANPWAFFMKTVSGNPGTVSSPVLPTLAPSDFYADGLSLDSLATHCPTSTCAEFSDTPPPDSL